MTNEKKTASGSKKTEMGSKKTSSGGRKFVTAGKTASGVNKTSSGKKKTESGVKKTAASINKSTLGNKKTMSGTKKTSTANNSEKSKKAPPSSSRKPAPVPPSTGYWLFKSEPDVYSIDDLKKDGTAYWEGVRNYQARNLLRDSVRKGDLVLFYHSNAEPPGVAGIARICKEGYPDHTAFDPKAKYFDEKSAPDNPTWFMVDVAYVEKFKSVVSLSTLKETPGLEDMMVTRRGARLSIQQVTEDEWKVVMQLAGKKP